MMMTPPPLPLMLPAVEAAGADGLATRVLGTCGRGATSTRASAEAAVTTCGAGGHAAASASDKGSHVAAAAAVSSLGQCAARVRLSPRRGVG